MKEIWTPEPKVMPKERKAEGGTYFDDELMSKDEQQRLVAIEQQRLVAHLNERPDHVVYVGGSDERHQMRSVFNAWFNMRLIRHHPTIKIDYGVKEGAIRLDEDR